MGMEAITAVWKKAALELPRASIERVYAELPPREARRDEEHDVAIGLSLAYSDRWRPIVAAWPCRTIAAEIRSRIGADGRYVELPGTPLELVGNVCSVGTEELERRYGVDFFDLWEQQGGNAVLAGDTDEWTRWEIAEINRRCPVEPASGARCPHM